MEIISIPRLIKVTSTKKKKSQKLKSISLKQDWNGTECKIKQANQLLVSTQIDTGGIKKFKNSKANEINMDLK